MGGTQKRGDSNLINLILILIKMNDTFNDEDAPIVVVWKLVYIYIGYNWGVWTTSRYSLCK